MSNQKDETPKSEVTLDDLEQVTGAGYVVCMAEGKVKVSPFITTEKTCNDIKHDIAES